MSKALRITLRRSTAGRQKEQRATAKALGLTKLNRTVVWPDTPAIRGMARAIHHLVEVEEVEAEAENATA